MVNIYKTLYCIGGSVVVIWLLSCGPGNSSVVYDFPQGIKVAGHITDMNGDAASGAIVSIRSYNYLPQPSWLKKKTSSTAVGNVFSTLTDSRGWFSFDSDKIDSLYSETARENGRDIDQFVINAKSKEGDAVLLTKKISIDRAFIESSTWININSLDVGTVLKPASTIKGTIVTQAGDHLEGFVLVYGLNTYTSIKPDGFFQLDNVPEGSLRLLFLYAQSDTGYAEVITTSGTTSIIDTSDFIDRTSQHIMTDGNGDVDAPDYIGTGKPVVISAVPQDGYEFRYWNVTDGRAVFTDSTAASTTVTLESTDAVIEAIFGILTFEKTFLGADIELDNIYHRTAVLETRDGGYALTGVVSTEVCLIKTDAEGDSLWVKSFSIDKGNPLVSSVHLVRQTTDDGFILAGYNWYIFSGYNYLLKTDTEGDSLWAREEQYTGCFQGVQQTNDGGFVIAGHTSGRNVRNRNALIKLDANGNLLWERTFSDSGDYSEKYLNDVQQTGDGGYILAGSAEEWTGEVMDGKAVLRKITAEGDTVWEKTYGDDNGVDGAYSVRQTDDGGFVVAGYTDSYGAGGIDVYVIKTDGNGEVIWEKTCGGIDDEEASSIELTGDGGFIIAGTTASFGAGARDAYLVKMDSNGDTVWTSTFGDSGIDEAYSARQTTDGGYILTGYTTVGENNVKTFLIKTDEYGNVY